MTIVPARVPKRHRTAHAVAAAGRIGFVPSGRVPHDPIPADLVDPVVQFAVFGAPAPQGSKSPTPNGGMKESSEGLHAWRDAVRDASMLVTRAAGWRAIDEPVFIGVTFTMPPTAAASKRGDVFKTGTPDLDKLLRAVGDALQPRAPKKASAPSHLPTAMAKRARDAERDAARRLSVLHDDSRIVGFIDPQKVYPGKTRTSLAEHPGAFIEVWLAADLLDPIGRHAIRRASASRIMQIANPDEGWPAAFSAAARGNLAARPIHLANPLAPEDAAIVAHALMADGPDAVIPIAEAS